MGVYILALKSLVQSSSTKCPHSMTKEIAGVQIQC
ncbi:hypothetical protein OIU74_027270 [Salix koriyanagi]|uniref:Uncharacterized protein n=1 Tax=Salix koriyanagi TaxID=2511006 RepID=A0A9Q1A4M6_9ROSI|nr:hypothetical protein OIU74_027270 [Salix koriyanagi]